MSGMKQDLTPKLLGGGTGNYGAFIKESDDSIQQLPSNKSDDGVLEDSKIFKIFKTGIMVFTWTFIGIFTAIIGATLIDLTEIAGCSYAQIGQALTGLHLAMPVGSIGGGILCGRYPDHLDFFITVFLSSLALSSAALPWCSHLWLMASVMVVQGLSRSALTCCGNVMMIQIWREKTAAPLHAMHFGTGFGSFLAPLLVSPFLSPQRNSSDSNATSSPSAYSLSSVTLPANGTGNATVDTGTHIYIPYGIEGGYGVICACLFFMFYLRHRKKLQWNQPQVLGQPSRTPRETRTSFRNIISPAGCARGNFAFGLQMACLLFLFYCCVIGVIVSYSTYLLPVTIEGHANLSKKEATFLMSAYWGSFAAGRFVSAFVAKFVQIHIMFVIEMLATLGTAAVLAFWGLTNSLFLWISTCAFAFFCAPVFPSGVAWANVYLDVNGPLMSVFQSGVGVGAFVAGIYGGYGLQEYGPNFPLYLNFSFAIGLVTMYVIMQIVASCHGRKQMVQIYEPIQDISADSGSVIIN
ncbi:sodium-dependent glucose transporter 1C-like [Liolophura sinensis]|uniref:sodium-dependent glucose transporter 1C-like n=1 Tax=Liolophura sinensis TaxID=3198878 RepID=UPI003158889D